MSFRTISMLAIIALIAIVAMNMNRSKLEASAPNANGYETASMETEDDSATEIELEADIQPNTTTPAAIDETIPPAEISDDPIPAPSAEETPAVEEMMDDKTMEEAPIEQPATGGDKRVDTGTGTQG